jgi:biotin carboxyl carrier protein
MLDTSLVAEDSFSGTETEAISERLVVAPAGGRFRALPSDDLAVSGEWVEPGTVLGVIEAHGARIPVCSPFRGWVKGMLALHNQPVKQGDALFWIRGYQSSPSL